MSYTAAELVKLKAARESIIDGTRKVRLGMGDKSLQYANLSLEELNAAIAQAEVDVAAASRAADTTARKRFFMGSTSKGL
jgi:hypothetical protein